jgi:hypothetical protein
MRARWTASIPPCELALDAVAVSQRLHRRRRHHRHGALRAAGYYGLAEGARGPTATGNRSSGSATGFIGSG